MEKVRGPIRECESEDGQVESHRELHEIEHGNLLSTSGILSGNRRGGNAPIASGGRGVHDDAVPAAGKE
jgi:hypothetical protein